MSPLECHSNNALPSLEEKKALQRMLSFPIRSLNNVGQQLLIPISTVSLSHYCDRRRKASAAPC